MDMVISSPVDFFFKSIYDKGLIAHKSLVIIDLFLVFIFPRLFSQSFPPASKKTFLPSVDLCNRYPMPAAKLVYCNTGIKGFYYDLVFLIRGEFAVRLSISTACRIGFRMLFMYLFFSIILLS
jgi:hypothetical protein